jgi:immune inhibitor A
VKGWHKTVGAAGVAAAVGVALLSAPAQAVPSAHDGATSAGTKAATARSAQPKPHSDNFAGPLAKRAEQDRAQALRQRLDRVAKARPQGPAAVKAAQRGRVERLKNGRYVELEQTRTDRVLAFLVQFGDQTDPRTGGTPGPVHNTLAKPDRNYNGDATDDNTTLWRPNFSRSYYKDLFFGKTGDSFNDFYQKQSSGRFGVTGDVSNWVTVPYNEARYGSNELGDADTSWPFIEDTVQAWYDAQVAAGKTKAQIVSYLKTFDVWDRNDFDHDGTFDEPDGYIDHFEAIHAGAGEEAGGGDQGADAIWSHRSFVNFSDYARTGPAGNISGGTEIGDTGIWVGDYTTEPENGGLGVFTHEFGHDLGLPDLYDTNGGENSTGFWTLMSSGSWLNEGKQDIGSRPGYMGAWEKLQLGWLDYDVIGRGSNVRNLKLGLAEKTGPDAQAVVVQLPDKTVTQHLTTPASGTYEYWSGKGNNLQNTMTRTVDLTGLSGPVTLSGKSWFDIEEDFDFAFIEASEDGEHWAPIDTWTGSQTEWKDFTEDLSAYAGKKFDLRIRYGTDGGFILTGLFLDDLTLTAGGTTVFSDGAETVDPAWTLFGWIRTTGTETGTYPTAYLAENRQYVGYDRTLRTGPYQFAHPVTQPDWVEHFPYHPGVLVTYWDASQDDNNTSVHPGAGQILPVEARPDPIVFPNGRVLTNRRSPFDATFGVRPVPPVTFHTQAADGTLLSAKLGRQPAIPVFDDSDPNRYYRPATNPQGSVRVAGAGVKITVTKQTVGGYIQWLNIMNG